MIFHCRRILWPVLAGLLVSCASHPKVETTEPESVAEADWAALAQQRLPLLEVCERPGVEEGLLCGTLEVYENRAAQSGRRIGLSVVVVPAALQPIEL